MDHVFGGIDLERKIVVGDETIRSLKSQATKCKQICLKKGKPFTERQRVVCTKDREPYRLRAVFKHTLRV